MALARVSRGLAKNDESNPTIELSYLHDVDQGLTYAELLEDPILSKSEPLRFRNQGTLFALDRDEADHTLAVLSERDAPIAEFLDVEGRVGANTKMHAFNRCIRRLTVNF